MTLEQFNKLKEDTKKNLEYKLALSKQKIVPYKVVTEEITEKFQLLSGAEAKIQLETLEAVVTFAKATNGNISHIIFETTSGRVGYYSHTNYYVKYDRVVDAITEKMVKKSVHKALVSIMGLTTHNSIDCKLMQLFKDGEITWEALVKAHKEDCTL